MDPSGFSYQPTRLQALSPTCKETQEEGSQVGGILVYYKDTFDIGVKLMSQYNYAIWLKLDKNSWYGI